MNTEPWVTAEVCRPAPEHIESPIDGHVADHEEHYEAFHTGHRFAFT